MMEGPAILSTCYLKRIKPGELNILNRTWGWPTSEEAASVQSSGSNRRGLQKSAEKPQEEKTDDVTGTGDDWSKLYITVHVQEVYAYIQCLLQSWCTLCNIFVNDVSMVKQQ